ATRLFPPSIDLTGNVPSDVPSDFIIPVLRLPYSPYRAMKYSAPLYSINGAGCAVPPGCAPFPLITSLTGYVPASVPSLRLERDSCEMSFTVKNARPSAEVRFDGVCPDTSSGFTSDVSPVAPVLLQSSAFPADTLMKKMYVSVATIF